MRFIQMWGPVALVVFAGFLTVGIILFHVAQDSASTAWLAFAASVCVNIAVNVAMTKQNLASREVAPGESDG